VREPFGPKETCPGFLIAAVAKQEAVPVGGSFRAGRLGGGFSDGVCDVRNPIALPSGQMSDAPSTKPGPPRNTRNHKTVPGTTFNLHQRAAFSTI
jgi:hypothetical protein